MQALDFVFKDDFKQRLDYKKFEEFILPCDRTVSLDYIAELFPVFLASLFTAVAFTSVVRDAVLKCGASTGEPFGVFLDWLGVHD